MEILIGIAIFILVYLLIGGAYFAFKIIRNPEKKRVQMRLKVLSSAEGYENESIDIVRKRLLSEIPWLNRGLLRFHRTDEWYRFLEQAGTQRTLGFFVLLSMVLASAGFLGGSLVTSTYLAPIPAVFLAMLPSLYVYSKRYRRMQKFERQLPDTMELIARVLRAGHAFSSGLKMVADEFDDPIGTEFDRTLNEINFGVDVNQALKNLLNRVDCPDLNFFIISVMLQRETGGNLAEILENIARLIRERFKLRGRIRVASAEGKLSAIILVSAPFVVAFAISLINPEYARILITDPLGKRLVAFALVMMIVGVFIIRRMIKIKV